LTKGAIPIELNATEIKRRLYSYEIGAGVEFLKQKKLQNNLKIRLSFVVLETDGSQSFWVIIT